MSAGLIVSLKPSLTFMIDYIGGPTIGASPYLEMALTASPNTDHCEGMIMMMNWGVHVTLGAKIDIHLLGHTLYQHTWGPSTIYQLKKPIGAGCLPSSASSTSDGTGDSEAPTPLPSPSASDETLPAPSPFMLPASSASWIPGTVWAGNVTAIASAATSATCTSHAIEEISLQFLGPLKSGGLSFIGARNYRGQANGTTSYACLTRAALVATFSATSSATTVSIAPDVSANGMAFSNCSSPSTQPMIEDFGSTLSHMRVKTISCCLDRVHIASPPFRPLALC
jgi:hypothetical protein